MNKKELLDRMMSGATLAKIENLSTKVTECRVGGQRITPLKFHKFAKKYQFHLTCHSNIDTLENIKRTIYTWNQ